MSQYIQSYAAVGLYIPEEDPIFKSVVESITAAQLKSNPDFNFENDYDDLVDNYVYYISDPADIITADYELRAVKPIERQIDSESGLIFEGPYPRVIGGSFKNQEEAIAYFQKEYGYLLPEDFPIKDYIAFITYSIFA